MRANDDTRPEEPDREDAGPVEVPVREGWDFWEDVDHDPALNMAIDEALLQTAPVRGRPLLRFYRWDRPAVSIGYVQQFAAAPADVAVVRRPTGGGVVFHDHDFTYSVVLPDGHWLTGLNRLKSYDWINRAVLTGLRAAAQEASLAQREIGGGVDRGTMVCFRNPTRYDILVGERKVAGSAQRRTRTGILHQGSIHFGGPLPVPRCELSEAVQNGFRTVLRARLDTFEPHADLLAAADELVLGKYGSDEWNRRR